MLSIFSFLLCAEAPLECKDPKNELRYFIQMDPPHPLGMASRWRNYSTISKITTHEKENPIGRFYGDNIDNSNDMLEIYAIL
jgi:hypothetical protein